VKRLLGFLGWLGVALVVAAVAIRFSRPDLIVWSQRLALAGLAVTIAYGLTQWREIGRSFQGRGVKYGSIAATSVVVFLGILVGLNWVASRQNKRWDLTSSGRFSLSEQTAKLLGGLERPVVIRVFYVGSADQYRDQLDEYTYLSKQVTAQYVDAERNPIEAEKHAITQVPTFVLEYEGRTERATASDEQTLTNALKKVIEGKAKKIYFVQGHGEADPTASETQGYTGIADALKTDNFETDKLTLAQQGKVPDDATVVVVAGPQTDLLAPEIEALKAFLKRGGKVALFIDPPDRGTAPDVTNVLALAREWGIEVGRNVVIDASGLGQIFGTDASVPVAMPVRHAITDRFAVMTAFPLARSVTPLEGGANGLSAQRFLETSPQSWAETNVTGLYSTGRPERNEGDQPGPVSIAAAVSAPAAEAPAAATPDAPKPESRVVVIGDSDFASNRALGIQGNRELFLNAMNWLAQQEDLIAIRPKDPDNTPITLTADQGRFVFWFAFVLVPALLFGNAARVWWKRR
jgi:ABC-type uncharacterized transport system involved in gliding motility auxiliary subunit